MLSRKLTLEQLRNQRIIKNPKDIITRTWLRFHPSLGKNDEVVWKYEIVRDEFNMKICRNELQIFEPYNHRRYW
jgi:hypothetical protein